MKKLLGSIEVNRIYQFDCVKGMKSLIADGSVELIIADPQYNIGVKGTKVEARDKHHKTIREEWDSIPLNEFFQFNVDWLTESYRVLKDGGSLLVWGTDHNIHLVYNLIEKIGFKTHPSYIWFKTNAAPNWTGRGPIASTEVVCWASKGSGFKYNLNYAKSINNGKNIKNVFTTSITPPTEKKQGKFPCQKRLAGLTDHLINLHSDKGDTILVPFAGSGTEVVAAQMLERNWVAFEREPKYIELANKRLDNLSKSASIL